MLFKIKIILFCFISICHIAESKPLSIIQKDISKDNLKRHIEYLSSDKLQGRSCGTEGENMAAEYLSSEFSVCGLMPIGSNNKYFQYIPMHSSFTLPATKLTIYNNGDTAALSYGTDYVLFKSGEQTYIPKPVELVFAGYGIIAPEYDYNDYNNIQVEGKIAVMFAGEPISNIDNFFAGKNITIYSYPELKHRLALSRGAAGTIIIPNPDGNDMYDWNSVSNNFLFEDVALAYSVASRLSVLINPAKAAGLFAGSKYSIQELMLMHNSGHLASFDMKCKISFRGEFRERDFIAKNIISMIPGSDKNLKSSYIIVSAHYDHLGIGPAINGDSIYNGAFDNAAGVSALLEIARYINSNERPKRSLIFLLTTGEEKGLLGSGYYCDNPVAPLYKTIANINIDGLAMFGNFNSITLIGTEYSDLGNFAKKAVINDGITIGEIPAIFYQNESFNFSDQLSFSKAGIPSALILDLPVENEKNLQKFINYSESIYHTPFDDISQEIDLDAATKHIAILIKTIYEIANSETAPKWNSDSPFINARLRSQAERR